MSARAVWAETREHTQRRHTLVWEKKRSWMDPLNAINPLDTSNKGLKIVFYMEREKKEMQLLHCNPCVMTNINARVGWQKWTFNETESQNFRMSQHATAAEKHPRTSLVAEVKPSPPPFSAFKSQSFQRNKPCRKNLQQWTLPGM